MPETRAMREYDAEDEVQIRARVEEGLNPLTHGQGQYLLDQLDLARDAVVEASQLSREVTARVDRLEANRDAVDSIQERTQALLAKAREVQAENRAGVAEERVVVGGLHTRLRKMEGEMQAELDVLRQIGAAASNFRVCEIAEDPYPITVAREALDDALLAWAKIVEDDTDG